jgi:hypothetical protein
MIQLNGNTLLTGPLPATIGEVTTTRTGVTVWLHQCDFTGTIPASWANLTDKCTNLRIQGNSLSGEIPAEVKAHANWGTWNAALYICPQKAGFGFTNCD